MAKKPLRQRPRWTPKRRRELSSKIGL